MEQIRKSKKAIDKNTKSEINRGRKEIRSARIYKINNFIKENWPSARRVIYLKRERKTKRGSAITHSYYISSAKMSAKKFAEGIRNHWGIENRLHYVKDVVFKEDHSKIKGGRAPAIFSLIRNLVINIIRLNNGNQITKFMRNYSGDVKGIMKLLE